jgi:hypothetical protein
MVDSSTRAMGQAAIGKVEAVTIECETGCSVSRWLDEAKHFIITILIETPGSPGQAKMRLKKEGQRVRDWFMTQPVAARALGKDVRFDDD